MKWDDFSDNQPRLVMFNGRLTDVAEFVGVPINQRPTDIYCPECDEKVFLRLGDIRRPHYAHYRETDCGGSSESHAHWHTKGELAEAFERVTQVGIYMRCRKCKQFRITHSPPIQGWAGAHEEYMIGKYRADVGLVDASNAVILAIEVLVTHEVESEKRDYFERNGVAWVEVRPNDNVAMNIVNQQLHLNAIRFGNISITEVLCKECRSGTNEVLATRTFEDEWVSTEQYPIFDDNGRLFWQTKYESVTDSRRLPQFKTQPTGRVIDDIGNERYLLRLKLFPEQRKR